MPLIVTALLGLVGAFLTSYTRARAEALGLDAKVGLLQRPERVVLLSAPQAFFGLVLDGWVLAIIIVILTVTAWITVVQRVAYVVSPPPRERMKRKRAPRARLVPASGRAAVAPRPLLKGE